MFSTNEKGKWLTDGNVKILIEPSESYWQQRALEEQQRLEQELLESLKPNDKDVLMAEIELNTINLLLELGVA